MSFKLSLKDKRGDIMYKIQIYKDEKGNEPVTEYLNELSKSNSKDSRIKLRKILEYIKVLKNDGLACGQPYIKHIDRKIWELRPLRDRIFLWPGITTVSFCCIHSRKILKKHQNEKLKKQRKNLIT